MLWYEALIWGCLGGISYTGIELLDASIRSKSATPWRIDDGGPGGNAYLLQAILRVLLALIAVSVLSATSDYDPWVLFGAGVAAPSVMKASIRSASVAVRAIVQDSAAPTDGGSDGQLLAGSDQLDVRVLPGENRRVAVEEDDAKRQGSGDESDESESDLLDEQR